MKKKLSIIIKLVNFVKKSATNTRLFSQLCKDMDSNHKTLLFYTSVRWLSKSNMLDRVYELMNELKTFLESRGKHDILKPFLTKNFQLTLAYFVDIFDALNNLNLLLQGKKTNRLKDYDAINAFIAKLTLWIRRTKEGNATSFPNLDNALVKNIILLEGTLKSEIETHLHLLKQEFERYFPDLNDTDLPQWKLTRNPFRINEDILPDCLQEEFLELKHNSNAKDDFEAMAIMDFWVKYTPIYQKVGNLAIRTLVPFSSTYMCESGFAALANIKTVARNKLDLEADLRCALSDTKPQFKLLVAKKQLHPSH